MRENTASLQSSDPVLGPIIRMRLASDLKPRLDEVLSESETSKKLMERMGKAGSIRKTSIPKKGWKARRKRSTTVTSAEAASN